jgi:hypothetical protein
MLLLIILLILLFGGGGGYYAGNSWGFPGGGYGGSFGFIILILVLCWFLGVFRR